MRNSAAISWGAKLRVGSSRMSTCASASRSLSTSTFCRSPIESRQTGARRVHVEAIAPGRRLDAPADLASIQDEGQVRDEQREILGNAQGGDLHEILEDHADAQASRVLAAQRISAGRPSKRISPASAR